MTIDTTQPIDKRFKKNFNDPLKKMTINEQIKILDHKIRSNQAQYDLDRQNAKISALSSGELDKYEYLTGEDLEYKPDVLQKTTFEYSPLGQVFNKGLDASEKHKGLLKRLKIIEGKNEQQLGLVGKQGDRQLDLIGGIDTGKKVVDFYKGRNKKILDLVKGAKREDKENRTNAFYCRDTSGYVYEFNKYLSLTNFRRELFNGEISLDEAKNQQNEMSKSIKELKNVVTRKTKYTQDKEEVINNAEQI